MSFRLLDGAIGTELQRRGFALRPPAWSVAANEEAPERVRAIHQDYLAVGAQCLSLNSFGLSAGLDLDDPRCAQRLAQRAQLALSLARLPGHPPLRGALYFDPPSQERAVETFLAQARALLRAGVQHLSIETLRSLEGLEQLWPPLRQELEASRARLSLSFCVGGPELEMLLERLRKAQALDPGGPLFALGLNCIELDSLVAHAQGLQRWLAGHRLGRNFELHLRPHLSGLSPEGQWDTFAQGPERFGQWWSRHAAPLFALNPALAVGCCCGGGPAHLRALKLACQVADS